MCLSVVLASFGRGFAVPQTPVLLHFLSGPGQMSWATVIEVSLSRAPIAVADYGWTGMHLQAGGRKGARRDGLVEFGSNLRIMELGFITSTLGVSPTLKSFFPPSFPFGGFLCQQCIAEYCAVQVHSTAEDGGPPRSQLGQPTSCSDRERGGTPESHQHHDKRLTYPIGFLSLPLRSSRGRREVPSRGSIGPRRGRPPSLSGRSWRARLISFSLHSSCDFPTRHVPNR